MKRTIHDEARVLDYIEDIRRRSMTRALPRASVAFGGLWSIRTAMLFSRQTLAVLLTLCISTRDGQHAGTS